MNKLANVVFAYSPKNDDELELKVGDKIEVIGFEEEGWWKGQLRGRIGVFPSNFVQVVDTSSNIQTTSTPPSVSQAAATASKLNSIFGAKAASAKQPTSLSSTSLSSNNSTSCGAINNIANSTSNNNLNMINNNNNNTPVRDNSASQPQQGLISGSSLSNTTPEDVNFSERRPKPIKGIGYGDIFASGGAKLKPLPLDPGGSKVSTLVAGGRASERIGLGSSPSQKQIPKKPPPPTPTNSHDNLNGSPSTTSSEQAPALPPKPNNQFSPHIHQTRPVLPTVQPTPPHHVNSLPHQAVKEKARVLYAYDPLNDDELAMKVGDIIEIIDKDIEDAGWWKGELRGKIGVFPDNFVELIDPSEISVGSRSEWQHQSMGSAPSVVSHPTNPTTNSSYYNSNTETNSKIKSVFAGTPKGFSKELESNLEKHGSTPASFLSLKRNKMHQQPTEDLDLQTTETASEKSHDEGIGSLVTNTTKLNHITANRAKGPTRRPPSNILNKRNQFDSLKRELTNGRELSQLEKVSQGNNQNMTSLAQAPSMSTTVPPNHEVAMPSLSGSQQQQQHATSPSVLNKQSIEKTTTGKLGGSVSGAIVPGMSDENIDNEPSTGMNMNQAQSGCMNGPSAAASSSSSAATTQYTPKTSQRFSQQQDKSTSSSTSASVSTTPPWMVEWKKTHAEKKRDTPGISDQQIADIESSDTAHTNVTSSLSTNSTLTSAPQTNQVATVDFPQSDRKTSVHSIRETYNPSVKGMTSRYSADSNALNSDSTSTNRFTTKNVAPLEPTNNNSDQSPTSKPPTSLTRAGVPSKSTLQTAQGTSSRDSDTNGVSSHMASATAVAGASVTPTVAGGNQQNNSTSRFQSSRSMFDNNVADATGSTNTQQQPQQQTSSNVPPTQRHNNGIKSSNTGDISVDATLALKDELGSSIKSHYDKLFQQISDKVSNEVSELRNELTSLRKELNGMDELKRVVEVMKQELKACQSATDNQRKYIKELIGNLADERKKIAAMQVELDRNLK